MSREADNNSEHGHEGFVSRWSRRKSSARTGTVAETAPEQATSADAGLTTDPTLDNLLEPTQADSKVTDPETTTSHEGGELSHEAQELAEADLPPIDSLDENSDYSAFMAPNVGSEIRNLALRKLFRSQVFNIRDGLDDYDDDFTTFEKLGDIVTADMKHHAQRKAKLLEEEKEQEQRLAAEQANDLESADTDTETETDEQEPTTLAAASPDGSADTVEPSDDETLMANEQLARGESKLTDNAAPLHGKLRRRPNQT